jgi:acyl-CoA thioesterase-1
MRAPLTAALGALALACAATAQAPGGRPHILLFFGDSLTAGYGLEDPGSDAYPAVIQTRIAAAGLPWRVVNAGLSGETTSGGLRRVDWVLRQPADVFVLELGANDGLRGVAPPVIRANLEAIIERVRTLRPTAVVVLAGMRMPTNMGDDYSRAFAAVFPEVACREKVALIPFLLEGVGGRPDLNQGDGMHPTAAGDLVVADNVWRVLRPLLWERQPAPVRP